MIKLMQSKLAATGLLALGFALGFALAATGCRAHHLGDGTGRRYHDALEAQIASDAEVEPLGAVDAKVVMRTHRGLGQAAAQQTTSSSSRRRGASGPGLPTAGPSLDLQAK
jgi:hypothetical protein